VLSFVRQLALDTSGYPGGAMPAIAEEYRNKYAFTMTVESLGQIRVWSIEGILGISAIKKRVEGEDGFNGYFFMQYIVSKFATHLNQENEKEEGEEITVKEVKKLSPEEAEQIAEEIIKHHEYLFVDQNNPVYTELPPNEEGETLVDISEQKLGIPREEGEAASKYLYRLVLALSEREEIGRKALTESVLRAANQFSKLTSNFTNSFKMPDYPVILPQPNPQHITNRRLEDVLDILSAQKEVNEVTAKSINSLSLMGAKWEEDAKKSSKQASRYNVLNITIAIIALLISLLSLYIAYLSYKASLKP
jgi:hypothetical protein